MERSGTQARGRDRQRRRLGALTVAAAIGVAAIVLVLVTHPGETAPAPPGNNGPAVYPVDPGAVEVATGFVQAYVSFDAAKAISYLADGADVSVVGGAGGVGAAQEDWPLNLSWWKATGYRQTLDECKATGSSAAGTYVRCTLVYCASGPIRSDGARSAAASGT
ncbi:MAG: hypothetical protein ACXWE5_07320 [Actinomycetota bacterium]